MIAQNGIEQTTREIQAALQKGVQVKLYRAKAFKTPGAIPEVEGHPRTIEYVASDETPDRYGDVVRVKGWTWENFKANPTFAWSHNYELPPLGRLVNVWKKTAKGEEPALMSWAEYASADLNAFADVIYRMVRAGMIRMVSVGFMPKKWNIPQTKEEREELGLGEYGTEYLEQDLLELSQVPVPANPKAGATGSDGAKAVAEEIGRGLALPDVRKAFTGDDARIFVAHAGDLYAAASMPVLRDLGLLPGAPAVVEVKAPEPPKEDAVEAPEGGTPQPGIPPQKNETGPAPSAPDRSTETAHPVLLDLGSIKDGERIVIHLTKESLEVQRVETTARDPLAPEDRSALEQIKSLLKAGVASLGAPGGRVAETPKPDPKPAEPAKTVKPKPDAATSITLEGIHARLDRALSKFGK
jgi:hypothetical protein